MEKDRFPIIIGVTGHRDLCREELPEIRALAADLLTGLKKAYPDRTIRMLSALAEGADTICAEVALDMGIQLVCPLPMSVGEYETDFSGEARERFHQLLSRASQVFVAPHLEPEQPGRDYLYRQAGLYLVSRSHILLAVWNGSEENRDGCGTAAAVYYAQSRNQQAKTNPVEIYQIQVNRESSQTRQAVCAGWLERTPRGWYAGGVRK